MRSGGSGRTGNRKTVGEQKKVQRLSEGPISVSCEVATPGDTVLVRGCWSGLALRRADPQEVRSVSGADQRPVAKRLLPNCKVCGPCQGLTNVLLPSADYNDDPLEVRSVSGADQRPLAKYRPPGGMVRVREPITISLAKCRPLELTVRVRGQWASSCEVREPWEIRSLSGAD
jgi:hypothetical protein